MKRSLSFLVLSLLTVLGFLTIGTGTARASTPDGQTPSEETVCDGQSGAAYGLCNAYCEAMDCDSPSPQASPTACSRVRNNYQRITGQPLPCDVVCPCPSLLPLFGAIVNGTAMPDRCIIDASTVSVLLPDNTFAFVNGGATPPYCSDNEQSFVDLTAAEAIVCRDLLRRAAMTAGVACVPPE